MVQAVAFFMLFIAITSLKTRDRIALKFHVFFNNPRLSAFLSNTQQIIHPYNTIAISRPTPQK